jgi:Tfp pilus assembly protein PilF
VRKQKYFESGQRYFEKGQYPEAVIQFTNAIKVDPNYAEAHHQLGESYLRLQTPQGAFQELGRTLQLQPGNYETRIELANLLILGRNLPEANDQVELLLQQRPDDPAVHSLNSSLLAAQGKLADAIGEMQRTVFLDPGRWQFYLSLAILQTQDHQLGAAEASLRKVIELDPSSSQARILLGNAFQSQGRDSDAERQFLDAIDVDPRSPESRAALVRLYLKQGKRAEAEQVASRAKHDFPNDSSGYRMLASLYFLTGDKTTSNSSCRRASSARPADSTTRFSRQIQTITRRLSIAVRSKSAMDMRMKPRPRWKP